MARILCYAVRAKVISVARNRSAITRHEMARQEQDTIQCYH
jgi:hypothetical protein